MADDDSTGVTWADLTPEMKCVLYNAARASTLVEVALDWEPTSTPDQLVSQIPRLAEAVLRLEKLGLVEVYHRYDLAGTSWADSVFQSLGSEYLFSYHQHGS